MPERKAIISAYGLTRHPEGGWHREYHRSPRTFSGLPGYAGPRTALTAIYFLLARGDFSAFHRLRSEEAWVHLAGAPLEIVLLSVEPEMKTIASVADGGPPAAVVPAGALQAARPLGPYALVTCLVAPGFEYDDFDLPSRGELIAAYPAHAALIRELTR